MKRIGLCVVLGLCLVAVACAAGNAAVAKRQPGQMIDLQVTGGYRLPLFVVFRGTVDFSGAPAAPVTVFINDFSTRVTPEGKWIVSVPLASFMTPDESDSVVVTVRAFQDKFNLVLEQQLNLSEISKLLKTKIRVDDIKKAHP